MKNVIDHLSEYKSYHLNPKNVKTHMIGIPLIVFAILIPMGWLRWHIGEFEVTAAVIFIAVSLMFYFKLHVPLALGMLVILIPVQYLANQVSLLSFETSLSIFGFCFVIGWIFQFVGHKYEGRKPAFLDDLIGLIVGPYFLLAELYFAKGFFPHLAEQVTKEGIRKRQEAEKAKKETEEIPQANLN